MSVSIAEGNAVAIFVLLANRHWLRLAGNVRSLSTMFVAVDKNNIMTTMV